MEGEEKKPRPQDKYLKPLGSGRVTPEEELEIRRKGQKAAQAARKRNADIRAAVRSMLNFNSKGRSKSMDVEKMTSVEQLEDEGAPMIAKLVHTQFLLALNGDRVALDWICKMAGVEEDIKAAMQGLTIATDADAVNSAGGVQIHLIRGDKPKEDESEEDAATRAANRLAIVEAMKVVGESADAIGQAVAEHIANVEDVGPDE